MPKICLMCSASYPDTTAFCPTDGSALRAAVQGDDLIGELVAERYLITDMLSQGGMGSVYLASDVRLPQQFAIKVLKQQQTTDQSLIQRFRQEAEAVCRINHDRVARVFDFGFMADDRAYIVMEYVAGKTLAKLIEERGALDPIDAARITMMAAEGIDAAHRLGIVHRDLKPENVMILDDPGGGVRVKVLDFGIAKLKSNEADQGYTQPGFVIGTPAWMSPEQLLGETLDVRSDVYSLGLVAFALLTGEHAFTGNSEQAEMMARISVPPRTLAQVRPDIAWPAELLRLFDSTLSKEPGNRPGTAGQFGKAMLAAVQSHSKVLTPVRSTGAIAGVASSLAPAIHPPQGAGTDASAGSAASVTAPRSRTPLLIGVGVVAIVAAAGAYWQFGRGAPSTTAARTDTATSPISVPPSEPASQPVVQSESIAVGAPVTPTTAGGAATGDGRPRTVSPVAGGVVAGSDSATRPVPSAGAPATPTFNAELQRIMTEFDKDDSERRARETILALNVLLGRLRGPTDQGYAHNYLGKAYLAIDDKEKACASFERASALAGALPLLKTDSDEFRSLAGCRPS